MTKNTFEQMPETVHEMQDKGLTQLIAGAFKERISGKCFAGLYHAPFKYVMRFDLDGDLWGQNNYGTQDTGQWLIDTTQSTLTVSWKNGWDSHTTNGYADGDAIHLFDATTGLWRTTLLREISQSELSSGALTV